MKIRPVILCGGSGTRLWPNQKYHQAKQFINFGNWTLFGKTLERIKSPLFDSPVISTNKKYLKEVKKHLKEKKIKKFKIILEPIKKNTAPAILSSVLIKDIPYDQPLVFLSSDHFIDKINQFYKSIKIHEKYLDESNIFIFGIKPLTPSSEFGYFLSKKGKKKFYKVTKFIEKPNIYKAEKIIKKKAYWNSGMFFLRKISIINNFKKYQNSTYKSCLEAVSKSKYKNNVYYLNKQDFKKSKTISFDYAILEKSNNINAIKLNIPWSDLGSWKEICKIYSKLKNKYKKKKNIFFRPWGNYTNLYSGRNFLIKEISVKSKGILSLQKHFHRSEHWLVTQGKPKITLNKKKFNLKPGENIYIPLGSIHRIENPGKKTVKIIEAQIGSILKETDIIRYQDVYGRAN
ncbi:cupin domain-containing protein [Pelagibacterales bacterium SAG-MED41]|nr:cupin domain-containing protein [Pelagibacterales bacterium SAG-MED41]